MTSEAASVTVVHNVRIFDGVTVIPQGSVLVEQGLIADVRPRIVPPAGALVVNGRGRTLFPGLIDCHTHLPPSGLDRAAVFGVTTALDMSPHPYSPSASRPRVRGGDEDVRIVRGGPGGRGGAGDVVQVLVSTAHACRRLVVAHVTSGRSAVEAVAAGVDGLAHLFVDRAADAGFVEAVAESRAFVIPTLTALEALCGTPSGAELARDPRLLPFLDAGCRAALTQALPPLAGAGLRWEFAREAVRRLWAAGVPVLAGTDAPSPGTAAGVSIHRELELLVDAGLRPVDALAAATSVPARCFGLTDRGRVARGLYADLVLVDGDPTVDIRASRAVVGVWRRGVRVPRDAQTHRAPAVTLT
jgi:imidazolonepropionase-like amidohydrolase